MNRLEIKRLKEQRLELLKQRVQLTRIDPEAKEILRKIRVIEQQLGIEVVI